MKIENGVEKLAEILGLKMGQEFIVDENSDILLFNPYKMTPMGILDVDGEEMLHWVINEILRGELAYEPIVKPLLTKEEKDYLETVIKYSKYPITHFGVAESDKGVYVMCQCDSNNGTIYSHNTYVNLAFKNMKPNMMYTLKELGLEQ